MMPRAKDTLYDHANDFYDDPPNDLAGGDVERRDSPARRRAIVLPHRGQGLADDEAQREQEAREACERLAKALEMLDGRAWSYIKKDDGPPARVDGYIGCPSEPEVPVQVTAVGEPRRDALSVYQRSGATLRHDEAAEEIWAAIRHKRRTADTRVILAVRGEPGVHAIPAIVDAFRRAHAAELRSVGYREIWLIGSLPETSYCLGSGASAI